MSQLNEAYNKEKQQLADAVKEELELAKTKTKFELELDYNTRTQNMENELRRSMTAVRDETSAQKQKDGEIEYLRSKLDAMTAKRQKAINGLMMAQQKVSQLKFEYAKMRAELTTEVVWGRVGPKPPLIKAVVEKIQHVGTLEKAYVIQNEQLKTMILASK